MVVTSTKTILSIYELAIGMSKGLEAFKLDSNFLEDFQRKIVSLELHKLPEWALRNTADKCVRKLRGQHVLRLEDWKKAATYALMRDNMSDVEILPDGTPRVKEGSPTDVGLRLIGPVQNYSDET